MNSTPNTPAEESAFNQGVSLLRQGDSEQAIRVFNEILREVPDNVEAHLALYQIFQSANQWPVALEHLICAARTRPSILTSADYLSVSDAVSQFNWHATALEFASKAYELEPTSSDALKKVIDYSIKLGRWDLAQAALQTLKDRQPQLWESTNKVFYRQGYPYKDWQLHSVLGDLADGLVRSSTNSELSRTSNIALLGDLCGAITGFEGIAKSDNGSAEAHFNLGLVTMSLASVSGRWELNESAMAAFIEATQKQPEWADAQMNLGICAFRLPDDQRRGIEPIDCLRLAVQLDPTSPRFHHALGMHLCWKGQVGESFKSFTTYYRQLEERSEQHPLGKLGIRFVSEDMVTAIGHMGQTPDLLIKSQLLGLRPNHKFVLAVDRCIVANPALLKEWERYITVVTDPEQVRRLRTLKKDLEVPAWLGPMPDGTYATSNLALSYIQREWDRQGREPLLKLSDEQKKRGWDTLAKLGVPKGSWFVALHARDTGYKGEAKGQIIDRLRNADIHNYIAAAQMLTDSDGWVIRLGEPQSSPTPDLPRVIDYAHSEFKSDWMDVFLASQCRFFLGGSGGIVGVPQAYHVPLIATDFPPICPNLMNACDIFTPKLLYSKKYERLLTFKELMQPPFIFTEWHEIFDREQVVIVNNTAEEILEVTKEMLDRVEGRLTYRSDDDALQERFRALIPPEYGVMLCRVGRSFLARYATLL